MPSTSPEIKYTSSPAQKLFRVSISEPTPRHDSSTQTTQHQHAEPRRNSAGNVVPEVAQNWPVTPKTSASPEVKSSTGHGDSKAEVSKMPAKGVDPYQRWEIERGKDSGERRKSGGFWGTLAGAGSGGGVIR
jgi:hypothetical protein